MEPLAKISPGDRVRVKPEHDIPAMFRDNRPTEGVVGGCTPDAVFVNVPIDSDDPDEHSQCVPYPPEALELV